MHFEIVRYVILPSCNSKRLQRSTLQHRVQKQQQQRYIGAVPFQKKLFKNLCIYILHFLPFHIKSLNQFIFRLQLAGPNFLNSYFQVTWIRHRDVHILTVGQYTYTTDQRFLARHNPTTDEWTLVIKYVQERDAGIYECQIPSRIPRSYPINLNIVGKWIVKV